MNQTICVSYRKRHSTTVYARKNALQLFCLSGAFTLQIFSGNPKEFIRSFGLYLAHCVTGAAFHSERKISIDSQLAQFLLNPLHDDFSILGRCFNQKDSEFIATVSNNEIGAAR